MTSVGIQDSVKVIDLHGHRKQDRGREGTRPPVGGREREYPSRVQGLGLPDDLVSEHPGEEQVIRPRVGSCGFVGLCHVLLAQEGVVSREVDGRLRVQVTSGGMLAMSALVESVTLAPKESVTARVTMYHPSGSQVWPGSEVRQLWA
jgi:hypothetical protein